MTWRSEAAHAALPRRQAIIALAIAVITALAWTTLARSALGTGTMTGVDAAPWNARDLGSAVTVWLLMIAGMMLPVVTPTIQAYAVATRREPAAAALGRTGLFAGAYLIAWATIGALAASTQWAMRAAAPQLLFGVVPASVGAGALLLVAGAYQLTPLKHACLHRCRTPLGFLLTEWRAGRWGALVMGWRHARTCVLCCWAVMSVMFVTGMMNLWWMAALAVLMLAEQLVPAGHRVARVSGIALIAWGAWQVTGAV